MATDVAAAETYAGRAYEIYWGKTAERPAPAVVLLHGGKSDGATLRQLIQFETTADQYGLVAIFPSAPGNFWNDGRGVALGDEAGRDDAAYLANLVRHLGAQGKIEQGRVFFAGISNGGGMAMRMACAYPQLVAGLGVVATKAFRPFTCDGYQPVPTLFFHGTADRISPHAGRATGREGLGFKNKGKTYSSAETVEIWREMQGCAKRAHQADINKNAEDDSRARLYDFQDCTASLKYYEIIDGGHTWPGAREPGRRFLQRLLGPTNQDISANAAMVETWLGYYSISNNN